VKWLPIPLVVLFIFGILLAACSSSSRFGDVAPDRADGLPKGTSPRQGTPRHEAHTEPQEAKKPDAQNLPEE
jgi:hypothetical protein